MEHMRLGLAPLLPKVSKRWKVVHVQPKRLLQSIVRVSREQIYSKTLIKLYYTSVEIGSKEDEEGV